MLFTPPIAAHNADIVRRMRDPRVAVRLAAIREAVDAHSEAFAPYLALRIQRGTPREIALALPAMVPLLSEQARSYYSTTDESSAARALAGVRKQALHAITAGLLSPDPAIRLGCARLLASHPSHYAVQNLLRVARTDRKEVGELAAGALLRLKAREAIPLFLDWLRKPSLYTRYGYAVSFFTVVREPLSIPLLLRFSKPSVRSEALAFQGDPQAEEDYLADLNSQDETGAVRAAMAALGRLGTPRAREALHAQLGRSPRRTLMAMDALARYGETPDVGSLIDLYYSIPLRIYIQYVAPIDEFTEMRSRLVPLTESHAFAATAERRLRESTDSVAGIYSEFLISDLYMRRDEASIAVLCRLAEEGSPAIRLYCRSALKNLDWKPPKPPVNPPAVEETRRRIVEELDGSSLALRHAWAPFLGEFARRMQKLGPSRTSHQKPEILGLDPAFRSGNGRRIPTSSRYTPSVGSAEHL